MFTRFVGMSFKIFKLKKYATVLLSALLILPIMLTHQAKSPAKVGTMTASGTPQADISLFAGSRINEEPSLSAKSAVLLECNSKMAVFEKNAHARMPMASTTKIMTALVVIRNASLTDTVMIPKEACGIEGSSVYLREGEKFTVEELLYALMLASANDAAAALAIHTCGSIEDFAKKMNECAAELGLRNTHFTNPHGLFDEDHYTTAYELALIACAASENDTFRKITSTQKTVIRRDSKESARLLTNHNKLLRSYDGCFGIKTGFTKKSGRCLVSGAERDGMSFIAVTLDAPDDWNDHRAMLNAAFMQYEKITPPDGCGISYMLPVSGSYQSSVLCQSTQKISVIVNKGEKAELTCKIYARRMELAPVHAGQKVGKAVYILNGSVIAECELLAVYSAAKRKN